MFNDLLSLEHNLAVSVLDVQAHSCSQLEQL